MVGDYGVEFGVQDCAYDEVNQDYADQAVDNSFWRQQDLDPLKVYRWSWEITMVMSMLMDETYFGRLWMA